MKAARDTWIDPVVALLLINVTAPICRVAQHLRERAGY
jgi:hypothetical protein